MYNISCLVTIIQAVLSLESDGHVYVIPRYLTPKNVTITDVILC